MNAVFFVSASVYLCDICEGCAAADDDDDDDVECCNKSSVDYLMMFVCSEHLSDVMMISQAFTAISSRITGITVSVKITDILLQCHHSKADVAKTWK